MTITSGISWTPAGTPAGKMPAKTAMSRQGKKIGCYEAYPIVNCVEPVVLWGTSLTKTE